MVNKKSELREWAEAIIFAVILAGIIRTFIFQPFKIPSGSMRMTLIEGDRIMVNRFIYGARIPFSRWRLPALKKTKRGDVVVFISPEGVKDCLVFKLFCFPRCYIKRLVGLPGDTVEIKDRLIYVNGKPLADGSFTSRDYYNRGDFGQEGQKIIVPQDSYYVLGDNSANSQDSRYWGFVPKKNMLGQAFLIWWPVTRVRIIR